MLLTTDLPALEQETIRVSALHALAYCPRLFYLEEVEELYTQDEAVFAGRRLHVELEKNEDTEELVLESVELGLRGKVDAIRERDGQIIPYEHKRGRCRRGENYQPQAWESDLLQILAYACLIESALNTTVLEGRIRYHRDNVLVKIPVDDAGRQKVRSAVEQARNLRKSPQRPPVTTNEKLCVRCSLAPVCLPEEARLAQDPERAPLRLFPKDEERQIIHVMEPGTKVGKSGEEIKISPLDEPIKKIPARMVDQLVLHGFAQISTQALYLCAYQQIGVHFVSSGGRYIGSLDTRQGSIQRRIQQYKALTDPELCLRLARQLVQCRGQGQRRFLMRGERPAELQQIIDQMKILLKQVESVDSIASLLGVEGNLAALYFQGLPHLISPNAHPELQFSGRNRRPPQDCFNCLLGFGYALLLKDVNHAILTVGLEPALGFYHQPRSQAYPLGLDLMEIFRVPLVDMIVVASINRGQWQVREDFEKRGQQVWLTDAGRKKFIEIYERRKGESWKHPVTNYSLTYRRLIELEVRLLEKEWNGEGGLFAQLVLR
ncbi:type I-MYXAN CRISPR-associated endonuclease Cas1 [Gloeomargaritales cyanobacterium VI4D9]|nr:type I-MYXAN CRISPR-associated endonuclease Cas1 [Gloeomargaritales cyanobacterium VI4D9]